MIKAYVQGALSQVDRVQGLKVGQTHQSKNFGPLLTPSCINYET